MSKNTTYQIPQELAKKRFDDIVFEHKNKAYGAYQLRKSHDTYLLRGFAISAFVILLLFLIPLIIFVRSARKEGTFKMKPKKVVRYSELSAPPPIELTPPPKVKLPPKAKESIKYLPPVAKPDEEVEDDEVIPTQDELAEVNPGIETVETDDSVIIDTDVEAVYEEPEPVKKQEPFTIVEEMPQFVGGDEALLKYIKENINYPKMALEYEIEGKVYVRFVINTDGSVSNIEVLRGIGGGCDEEAARVVKEMPNWMPGKQRGNTVPVAYVLPIRFTIRK